MKRALLLMILSLILAPFGAASASTAIQPGDLIKASGPAVYYYNSDGKRLVFPNEKTYFTWYTDFSNIKTITDAELAAITIGGNVTYRPGKALVKITTDPKVYAVDAGGILRWITTESIATSLYGTDWAKKVSDIPDAFFVDYEVGTSITSTGAFDPASILNANTSISSSTSTPSTPTDTTTSKDPVIDRGVVKTSQVQVGNLFRVTIDSNPTTGYAWKPTFDSTYLTFVTSTYVPTNADIVGGGGTEQFDFRAIKQTSQTDITFDYVRAWETGVAPAERRIFRMIIDAKPVSDSDITFTLNKTEAQAGEDVTLSASTTIVNPKMIKLNVNGELVQQCNGKATCTAIYPIPSSGTGSSYKFDAVLTAQDGSTATTTKTVSIVTSQTLSNIVFTISKTTIRPGDSVDINVNPSGVVNVRDITIMLDSTEVKRCENNPTSCKYSHTISGSAGTTHTVYAKLTSSGGLSYQTVMKSISVSTNDSPSVTITPGRPSMYKTETVEITVTASDDDGIGSMSIMQGSTLIKSCNGPAPCTAIVGPFTSFSSGDSLRYYGKATDLLGLTASSTQDAIITIL